MRRNRISPLTFILAAGILFGGNTPFAAPDSQTAKVALTDSAGNIYTIGPDGTLVKEAAEQPVEDPSFAEFDRWLEQYDAAKDAQKTALGKEGILLSEARRVAMKELIQLDPKRAFELAVKKEQRRDLPPDVEQNLEQFLQGRGEFGVMSQTIVETVSDEKGESRQMLKSTSRRTLTFDSRVYKAFVYGRREGLLTKHQLPFYGVSVDDVIAINESPIWILPTGQKPPAGVTLSKNGTKCPICRREAEGGIVGIVGSTLYYFDSEKDLEKFREGLWEAEQVIGPNEHA